MTGVGVLFQRIVFHKNQSSQEVMSNMVEMKKVWMPILKGVEADCHTIDGFVHIGDLNGLDKGRTIGNTTYTL